MKGYKAVDIDMSANQGDGIKLEVNKWYSCEGKLKVGFNGFHFCRFIQHIEGYYEINKSRIFEIEASGEIQKDGCKYVAEKIKLVRELTKDEIKEYFNKRKDRFVKSKNDCVRKALAGQGLCLDILVNDKDELVREQVALQGYGLDKLVFDKSETVRFAVAKNRYGLDILVNDESNYVKRAVAYQGYGLDILINDKNEKIKSLARKIKQTVDKGEPLPKMKELYATPKKKSGGLSVFTYVYK